MGGQTYPEKKQKKTGVTVLQSKEMDFRAEALNMIKSYHVVRGKQAP